jgi:2-dehydro-3-deoxygalactonokinase
MMRGEETELYGLYDEPLSDALYVLPGSHSKLIKTDEKGRITGFSTSLSGEMIAALSEGTILKGSLNIKESEINEKYLKKGCVYASENGLSSTLFKVRILDKGLSKSRDEVYSFFLGAILSSDYSNILNSSENTVVIGGKAVLRDAISLLLEGSGKKMVTIDDVTVETATAIGAMRIYKKHLEAAGNGKAL